jgi:hypothetical protein
MAILNLQFRNPMVMALVLHTHIATESTVVVDLPAAPRLLVESHHVYFSPLEGAKMGMP